MSPKFDPQTYWQKRLETHYDLMGVGYLDLGRAYNTWLYRLRRRIFLQTVRRISLDWSQQAVLDAGSGTGFYIDRWLELGVRRLGGVDLTPTAVAALQRRYPQLHFEQADLTRGLGPEHTRRYDAISVIDVLFHIVDDAGYQRALGHLAAGLKPGGWLILSENFLHGPRQSGMHQVSRRLDEIEAMLAATGLEVIERRPMFAWMNAPMDSRNPAHKLFWKLLARLVALGEPAGYLAGALLYPLELLTLAFLREGPSTEIMVCRKLELEPV